MLVMVTYRYLYLDVVAFEATIGSFRCGYASWSGKAKRRKLFRRRGSKEEEQQQTAYMYSSNATVSHRIIVLLSVVTLVRTIILGCVPWKSRKGL